MNPTAEQIHRLQTYAKGICWHPIVSLDSKEQQRLHELLSESASQLAQSEERVKALERLVHENTRMLDMCAMLTQDGPHCNKVGHITAQISRNRTLLSSSKTN